MPFIENAQEFINRQKCESLHWRSRRVTLFANGARLTDDNRRFEPPKDPILLLTAERDFIAAQLEQEERKFKQCQQYIFTQSEFHRTGYAGLPDEKSFKDLEDFAVNVIMFREDLEAKQKELEKKRGPTPAQSYQARRDQERQAGDAAIRRASIRI